MKPTHVKNETPHSDAKKQIFVPAVCAPAEGRRGGGGGAGERGLCVLCERRGCVVCLLVLVVCGAVSERGHDE